ncbi:hypothetical protein CKA32_005225 [Geitlerinema sp. FC II]|nr:hypothetical protein CKA32_005225 [Geitlerinema sp. FC II]
MQIQLFDGFPNLVIYAKIVSRHRSRSLPIPISSHPVISVAARSQYKVLNIKI